MPYYGYARQDRKDKPRVPISGRLLADLIESNHRVSGLITIDMHAEQEQGFFSIPVDNLTGIKIFAGHIREKFNNNLSNVVMLAADFGGAVRNRRFALALGGLPVCIVEKRRPAPNQSEILSVIGDIVGKDVIIFEDMIDTGGTAMGVIEKIMALGAKSVYLCATHGIFSRKAYRVFRKKGIQVATTDSIPRSPKFYQDNPWLTKCSIIPYFAAAIGGGAGLAA